VQWVINEKMSLEQIVVGTDVLAPVGNGESLKAKIQNFCQLF
jgi:hypothetical protein